MWAHRVMLFMVQLEKPLVDSCFQSKYNYQNLLALGARFLTS